jgi:hypothetical protein
MTKHYEMYLLYGRIAVTWLSLIGAVDAAAMLARVHAICSHTVIFNHTCVACMLCASVALQQYSYTVSICNTR